MMLLEMSRDPDHGGKGWEFGNCVWAPTEKESGGNWPFWSKIGQIQKGDLILHLRGMHRRAEFVGFSTAATNGYRTTKRPPIPGSWGYASEFFRADLEDFNPFPTPLSLQSVFETRAEELRHYFEMNKALPHAQKESLFYVIQSGRLQCLNGAYLSDLEYELAGIILGSDFTGEELPAPSDISTATGERIRKISARLGQSKFSLSVKANYGLRCCFPKCEIDDPRFLVGAHIARWADRKDLRGRLDNGLCFCLMHDKAFEEGFFTLDYKLRVVPLDHHADSGFHRFKIYPLSGQTITCANTAPSFDALESHWVRHGYSPSKDKMGLNGRGLSP